MTDEEKEPKAIENTTQETMKKEFGGNKPEFNRQIECEITDAHFQTNNELIRQDSKGRELADDKQYMKHWLQLSFQYTDPKTSEEKTFEQSYGSIREYKDRLWTGTGNNLTKVKNTLEAFLGKEIENIWDMPREMMDKKCLVKSESWEYGTNKGITNMIQDFVEAKKK